MLNVRVTKKVIEAESIASFEFAAVDGTALPSFSAGSHVDVMLPAGLVRQYSLCNAPSEQHRYVIAVLRDPASRGGSLAMHEVAEGDVLQISEPRNHFALVPARRILLLAGGIGVTPLLCMAERLATIGTAFEMHYCTRSPQRTAFARRIAASVFSQQAHFHFDDGAPGQKFDAARVLAEPSPDLHAYICGPAGFIDHVLSIARAQGWQQEQLHLEYFSAAPVDTSCDGSFQVKLASSGRTYTIPAEKSVADVLIADGIKIPMSCEQGVCGTCLIRVLEGECEHRDMFLSEAEQAKNDQFTPCCSRAKSRLLVLDI